MTEFSKERLVTAINGIGALLLMRIVSLLPWPIIDAVSFLLGSVAFKLIKGKRRIAERNICLCFPSLSEQQVRAMARNNFISTVTGVFELAKLSWAHQNMVDRWIDSEQITDLLEIDQTMGRPIIMATPHLTTAYSLGAYLGSQIPMMSIYHPPKNKWINLFFLHVLNNDVTVPKWFAVLFGCNIKRDVKLFPHRRNMGGVLRKLRKGTDLLYLPDQDLGNDKTVVFPPFFGIRAATVSAVHDFVRLGNATVVTCALLRDKKNKNGKRFTLLINDMITDLGEDRYTDVLRLNEAFEGIVLAHPQDYFWLHRRFKTRPADDPTPLY